MARSIEKITTICQIRGPDGKDRKGEEGLQMSRPREGLPYKTDKNVLFTTPDAEHDLV